MQWIVVSLLLLASVLHAGEVWPGEHWEVRDAAEVGLKKEKLEAMAELAGGRGCVVKGGTMVFAWGEQSKSGDVASAMKPVITTLMLMAVEDRKIGSVDDRVAIFEPRLVGKNEGITNLGKKIATRSSTLPIFRSSTAISINVVIT